MLPEALKKKGVRMIEYDPVASEVDGAAALLSQSYDIAATMDLLLNVSRVIEARTF